MTDERQLQTSHTIRLPKFDPNGSYSSKNNWAQSVLASAVASEIAQWLFATEALYNASPMIPADFKAANPYAAIPAVLYTGTLTPVYI